MKQKLIYLVNYNMSKCHVCYAVFKSKIALVIHTSRNHTRHDTLKFLKVLNDYLYEIMTAPTTPQETMQNISQIQNYLNATHPDTYAQLIKIKENLQELPNTEKYKVMLDEYESVLYSYMDDIKHVIDEVITSATATTK